jgi:choice-of-anchor A domain-containing protein
MQGKSNQTRQQGSAHFGRYSNMAEGRPGRHTTTRRTGQVAPSIGVAALLLVVGTVWGMQAHAAEMQDTAAQEQTTTINPMSAYNQWNVVAFKDAEIHAESEGAVAVGGTLSFSGVNVAMHDTATVETNGTTQEVGLLAGDVNFADSSGTLQVHDGNAILSSDSDVSIQNTDINHAKVNYQILKTGATYGSNPNISLQNNSDSASVTSGLFSQLFSQKAAVQTSASVLSAASCTSATAATTKLNGQSLEVSLTKGVTNYLTLTSAEISELKEIKFQNNAPSTNTGTSLVIEVTGESPTLNFTLPGLQMDSNAAILWNFPQATTVTQQGDSIDGSVLAPQASFIKNSANVQGTIVAASTVLDGSEQHFGTSSNTYGFRGNVALCGASASTETSQSASGSASQSASASASPSESASATASVSPSQSPSATASASGTSTPTASPSPSKSVSPSASVSPSTPVTESVSPSRTPSKSASPSRTPSVTPSASASTESSSPSRSPESESPTPASESPVASPSPGDATPSASSSAAVPVTASASSASATAVSAVDTGTSLPKTGMGLIAPLGAAAVIVLGIVALIWRRLLKTRVPAAKH